MIIGWLIGDETFHANEETLDYEWPYAVIKSEKGI